MKATLFLDISIDGFIARPDHSVTWSKEVWENYFEFCRKGRNLIIGRKSYDLMLAEGELEKLNLENLVVISSQSRESSHAAFVHSPQAALDYLRTKGETTAVIGGGRQTALSFLKQGLLDEAIFEVDGRIFGSGIGIFGEEVPGINLQLSNVKQSGPNSAMLHYLIRRARH